MLIRCCTRYKIVNKVQIFKFKWCLSTVYGMSDYWVPCLTTGYGYQVTKSSLSMLIYAEIPCK